MFTVHCCVIGRFGKKRPSRVSTVNCMVGLQRCDVRVSAVDQGAERVAGRHSDSAGETRSGEVDARL